MSAAKLGKKVKHVDKYKLKTSYAVDKCFSPFYTGGWVRVANSKQFIMCTCGDKVTLVNIANGLVEKVLLHEGDDVTCFLNSPDDKIIVTATKSLLLKQWSWSDEIICERTWRAIHMSPVLCMDFDPSSTLLATGGSDATIKVWDIVRQYCTHNLKGSRGIISCVKMHPSNLTIFSASDDYFIRMWDLTTSQCVRVMESHVSAVTCLDILNGSILVSAGRDSVVSLWNLDNNSSSNKPSKTIPVFEPVEDIVVLPTTDSNADDSEFNFATVGNQGVIKIWNNKSAKCIAKSKVEEEGSNTKVQVFGYTQAMPLPGTGDMLVVSRDHNLSFVHSHNLKSYKHFVGNNDEILDVKFFGENNKFVLVASNSPDIKVFNIETGACQLVRGHLDTVISLDVFRNKWYFCSCSKDRTVRLWKMSKKTTNIKCVAVGGGHTHTVESLTACKLKMSFMVSGSEDHTVKVWSIDTDTAQTLTVKHTVLAHTKDINSVNVSPNDKLFASGSQDKLAKLWSVADGKNLGTFRGHKKGVWCVQFSPMDQVLASSSADGTVKIWSLVDFSCLKTFEGHDCSVLKLAFISKGMQIITSGSDGLVKLWTVKSSECCKTLDNHSDKVWALSVQDDDETFVTGGADSTLIIWKDVTEQEQEEFFEQHEAKIIGQQELQNLLHEKKYNQALHRAIQLEHPFTALNVIREILWEENGFHILQENVMKMKQHQQYCLLKFAVSWNTNSRNCHEAQAVINIVLSCMSPSDIEGFSDLQTIIESLLPYTERHFQRLSRLTQQATFLDYTWQLMRLKVQDQ